ncbi:M-phase inducer phosphatase [Bactrocera dorsalis]|uniref:protein-tyrosine-phosphatase n=1 Tax=Bactrocera dorsalis TaxID=27457 RepID=A0A6I9V8Q3_BACDO|nr:M-phase inducer phosphatase [Bactrocera dorsalis]
MMWDTIAEETNGEMAMEFASCQMPHDLNTVAAAASSNGATRQRQPRNILGSPINDMVVDHQLSFYGDEENVEEPDQRSNVFDLPQQMGLLSPEGSPCRFQILQQQSVPKYNQGGNCQNGGRQRQSFANRLQKLQHNNAANGSTRTPTPPKSLRIFHSLSSGSMGSSSMEEDYMDLFEMESLGNSMMPSNNMPKIPSDLDSLFVGQIKNILSPAHRTVEQPQLFEQLRTPEMRRPPVRRCLSMTDNCLPKTPETLLKQVQEIATSPYGVKLLTTERNQSAISGCFKRPDPPSKTNSPVLIKRYRIEAEKENLDDSLTMSLPALPAPQPKLSHPPPLRKSMSMNDAEIMSALARSENKDEPDLIGDFSKPYVLPLMDGRHRDLKSISCDTMARLVRGEFSNVVANYRIIDCRYPYEFEGGHIRGAQNLYTHEQILEEFLTQQKTEMEQLKATNDHRRNIIIFHCEFSSERGPKLSRFLRSTDRERNTNCYPSLDYPEIYLLHNGYKEFYEHHSELCDPTAYRPMLEPAYNSAYRHFRSKTKSWNGDSGLGGATGRLKKSRSRLML